MTVKRRSKMADSVEVVLLDRRMPGLSGDEVLEQIRDQGYDSRVVMVTAVDPDFDIIEMGFDDYLVKPVSKDELVDMVDDVADRSDYESDIQEYYALVSKKALLESEKADRELTNNEEYQDLTDRVAGARAARRRDGLRNVLPRRFRRRISRSPVRELDADFELESSPSTLAFGRDDRPSVPGSDFSDDPEADSESLCRRRNRRIEDFVPEFLGSPSPSSSIKNPRARPSRSPRPPRLSRSSLPSRSRAVRRERFWSCHCVRYCS